MENIVDLSITDEEKIRAAYALNMCTVSISQIIDYADAYILEQEYDAILNNLNIENIPKDDALLRILTELLNTITYFRIEEIKKEQIEKKYQEEIKNAIWSAVPNLGVIVTSGNPVAIGVSLATQVGAGYMNYRKQLSDINNRKKDKDIELQIVAIEQFNALRRELFTTAWRLSERYQFPESWRLTERQIKQYNSVLIDDDNYRKYVRMDAIKDKFAAYPAFWYFFGHTAMSIAAELEDDNLKVKYFQKAEDHFNQFEKMNKYSILREDTLACSFALEFVDLLLKKKKKDVDRIEGLLKLALDNSGNNFDIIQLCVLSYLKIGNTKAAAQLLKVLVNEQYNTIINAQMLSSIYVGEAIRNNSIEARDEYAILSSRINSRYLYKMPSSGEHINEKGIENDFLTEQREILKVKCGYILDSFIDNTCIQIGKLIPEVDINKNYEDSYYLDIELRKNVVKDIFFYPNKKKKKEEYLRYIVVNDIVDNYFDKMNDFYVNIIDLMCIKNTDIVENSIREIIRNKAEAINMVLEKDDNDYLDYIDLVILLYLSDKKCFQNSMDIIYRQICDYLDSAMSIAKFAEIDSIMNEFCKKHSINEFDDGEYIVEYENDKVQNNQKYFGLDLLGTEGEIISANKIKAKAIEDIILSHRDNVQGQLKKSNIYMRTSDEFNEYFESKNMKDNKKLYKNAIAILVDKSLAKMDFVFTVDGIVPVIRSKERKILLYINLNDKVNMDILIKNYILAMGIGGGVLQVKAVNDIAEMNHMKNIMSKIEPILADISRYIVAKNDENIANQSYEGNMQLNLRKPEEFGDINSYLYNKIIKLNSLITHGIINYDDYGNQIKVITNELNRMKSRM